ncbi:hypothetical protein GGI02_005360, partial [Coemansia sp. RSA 2322]
MAFQALASYVGTSVDSHTMSQVTVSNGDSVYTLSGLPVSVAALGEATAAQSLVQRSDGSVVIAWHIVLRQASGHWWSAHVNADTGIVEAINDWVSSAQEQTSESFRVYPRSVDSPADGLRQLVASPANSQASPRGWVSANTTAGNNAWAQSNPSGGDVWLNNHRPTVSGKKFDFTLDLTKQPSTYVDASITQLFYTVNTMHDLSFIYGFDEQAGNFQDVNYSGVGVGGDYVVAFAQDGGGTNNANFATPPDGQHGVMRMYVWTETSPRRDGSLEQDIVAHEYTHGISNRLTGGPSNVDCLNDGEAGGMGEGWSDTMANLLRIKPTDTHGLSLAMGTYVYGKGIRNYAYSTDKTTNPSTYKLLDDPAYQEVHAIGEVWAEMLYEVMWALMDKHGIASDLFS